MDNVTISRLAKLHPKLRDDVTKVITELNLIGIEFRITQGLRTIEEQDKIYAQGRTIPGHIVSNAKGGQSFHNYGLALDFCLLHADKTISFNMKEDVNSDKINDWNQVVNGFKAYGWEWGDRGYVDTPHVQKVFGLTPEKCLEKIKNKEVDNEGYILI